MFKTSRQYIFYNLDLYMHIVIM